MKRGMSALSDAVSVYDEPSHRVELEHPLFRVIRFKFGPSEKTLFHRHFVDSFFCFFSSTKITLETEEGLKHADVERGSASFSAYSTTPIAHRIANVGDAVMHGLDIEVTPSKSVTCMLCNALVTGVPRLQDERHHVKVQAMLPFCCPTKKRVKTADGYTYHDVHHARVELYKLTLGPGEATDTYSVDAPRLHIWYDSGTISSEPSTGERFKRTITAGSYAFDDRRFHGKLVNRGDRPISALIAVWAAVAAY